MKKADPQPPKSDPIWEGRSEGAIYTCAIDTSVSAHGADGYQASYAKWSEFPPEGPGAPVDPAVLARSALAKLGIPAPALRTAPRAGAMGVLGLPTWFWVEDTSRQRGPLTASASDRGLSVRLTAKLTKLTIKTGDGPVVSCSGVGLPYEKRYRASTPTGSCTHTYARTGSYRAYATALWTIGWSGGGQSGEFTTTVSDSVVLTVGEVQVLTS